MSKKVDILILSDNSLESVGGEQESTKIIINGVKEKYKIGIIQPGIITKPIKNVTYFEMTKKTRIKHLIKNPFAFMNYINKIRKIIEKTEPEIIHTQAQVSFFTIGLLSKMKAIPKNVKIIHTERGLYTKYNSFFKKLFFMFMKNLNVLVTTTEFNMNYWKQSLINKDYKLDFKVIENTAGDLFEKYDDSLKRKEDDKIVIGFAGRYASWKNWPLAVEISEKLNHILDENLQVKMAIGCLDKKSEIETRKLYYEMELLLGDRFFSEINIDLEQMNRFYYDIDVFILTSDKNTESFGRTLVEAMSRKNIVLTTDAGGSVEVVNNVENVCINSDEFVNRITYFYENKDLMIEEKNKNYKNVKDRYSLENNINKHLKLYEIVISE